MEKKTAMQYKTELARKLMYQSGHQIVATEISEFNNPDIISLTRSDKLIEYEIKISRADLMGELNSVKTIKNEILLEVHNRSLQGTQQMQLGDKVLNAHFRGNVLEPEGLYEVIGKCSKLDKHQRYLRPKPSVRNGYGHQAQPYQPNQFYFAVTSDLVPLAMEVCEGIAYGVIDLGKLSGSTSIVAKAGYLHHDDASRYDIWRMAHSLSYGYWDGRYATRSDTIAE